MIDCITTRYCYWRYCSVSLNITACSEVVGSRRKLIIDAYDIRSGAFIVWYIVHPILTLSENNPASYVSDVNNYSVAGRDG